VIYKLNKHRGKQTRDFQMKELTNHYVAKSISQIQNRLNKKH